MFENAVLSVFGLVFVVAGAITMYHGYGERAEGEVIAETETTAVRDLTPGPAEVKGTVRPAEDATATEAPISATEALAVSVEVEEQQDGSWNTIFTDEWAESLLVDDGTGEVPVDLSSAGELDLRGTETEVGVDDEPPAAVRRYVETESDLELPDRRSMGPVSVGERRRYTEGVLEPGDDGYVLGAVRETAAGWDRADYVIDEPTESGEFVLSNRPERELIDERTQSGLVSLAFGCFLALVGTAVAVVPWVPV
ncbi:E3 Ubiquitin ligase [Halovivax ruber XH-70]|uniref:RING-type E3 ubiquitin transferase n=1 Tax=Halovivax ruber (strain DSM 18193 / JCM 13892 / XH-70) TaxID=797302 RepID=L0I5X6_HALRX|nr:GIDE domain-containing protein [Halovivax ruber]AGB14925.1 E3 Ubiquitin ligase [Halovivax ruber XH-70]